MGVKITDYYEEYFGIKYALPKQGDFKTYFIYNLKYCILLFLDLIAIPDFVSGAMEHWGLVTFRETVN